MQKLSLSNSKALKDFKYMKSYIFGTFFLFLIQQSLYHFSLYFIYYHKEMIPRYITSSNEKKYNNFWINILNLGLNSSHNDGIQGFYSIEYLKCFVFVYLGSFIWWYFITPFLVYKYLDKKTIDLFYKFCFIVVFFNIIFFWILPIECLKEFQFDVNKDGTLIDFLLRDIYDKDYTRLNSLPSFHVTISWLCYIPFRIKQKNNNISRKIMFIQFIIAILVFFSTFIIKQHYIMDGIISIILTEVVFFFYFAKKQKNMKKK